MCYGNMIQSSLPVARKVHQCDECGRGIRPGRRYSRVVESIGGSASTSKVCRVCRAVFQEELESDECVEYGGLAREVATDRGWRWVRSLVRAWTEAKP